VRSVVLDDPAKLEALREPWQGLAQANERPYCLPAWQLAWLRHAAPDGDLRAVAVFDGEELVGLAPFIHDPGGRVDSYRLLASPISAQIHPLALPGREDEVARAMTEEIAGFTPRPRALVFTRLLEGSQWPGLLADGWPDGRRPAVRRVPDDGAPSLDLSGREAEDFLPSLSSKLRAQIRRARRALDRDGATIVLATADEMEPQVEALGRLHRQRMGEHESGAMLRGVEPMLCEAGRELTGSGSLRLWTIRAGEETISALLFVATGGRVSFWLGAFEDRWRKHSPGLVALMAAIEDSMTRGDAFLDLGPGRQDYKLRLANGEQVLETSTLLPRGPGYAMTRARLAPEALRRAVGSRLPEGLTRRLRSGA
jgi:CelD/BcsL family acetyltransferase involved in cellulose biosynthesis